MPVKSIWHYKNGEVNRVEIDGQLPKMEKDAKAFFVVKPAGVFETWSVVAHNAEEAVKLTVKWLEDYDQNLLEKFGLSPNGRDYEVLQYKGVLPRVVEAPSELLEEMKYADSGTTND